MATGIDFMAIARGREAALSDNYKDIRRIQEQEQYGSSREQQLAKQLQERQNREATRYLSTVMPNLQRWADLKKNPVDALLNQRSLIQNHADFQSMTPEVQTLILNGLGETAKLQMQALANSGQWDDLKRLTSAFGSVNPLNPLGIAVASGDPLQVFKAVSERSPGAYTLSDDQKFVVDRAGNQVPLGDWAAYTAAGLGEANSAAGGLNASQQAGQQQREQTAADELKAQEDTARAIAAIQCNRFTTAQIRAASPDADPTLFATPGAAPTTLNWVTAEGQESVPLDAAVPGAAVPGAAVPGAAVPGAAVPGAAVPGASETAVQQLVAQIQSASQPVLSGMAQRLIEQRQNLDQQLAAVKQEKQSLQSLRDQYQSEVERHAPVFSPGGRILAMPVSGARRQALEAQLAQLNQRLAANAAKEKALETSYRQIQGVAQQISAQSERLKLPGLPQAAQVEIPSWVTAVQGAAGQ